MPALYVPATYDAAANGTNSSTNTATSCSWSHTVGTGSNRLLLVSAHYTYYPTAPISVSGITWGATALTALGSPVASGTTSTDRVVELWYLLAPASGTNTVTITFTTNGGSYTSGVSTSWSTTSGLGTRQTGSGNGTTGSATVTGSNYDVDYDVLCVRTNSAPTNSNGTAPAAAANSSATNCFAAASYIAGSSAGVTPAWTWTPADNWALIAVALQPMLVPGATAETAGARNRASFY